MSNLIHHRMTNAELLSLDIRRGKASMDWYRAMRGRSQGEITWEAMIEAEDRVRELDAQLARAMGSQ